MFSITVSDGIMESSWWMMAMPAWSASMGRCVGHLFAFEDDAPAIAWDDAAQHLDQGRFAGAVFAHQSMHLAIVQVEIDLIQRMHAAVAFGDLFHTQDFCSDFSHSGSHHAFCKQCLCLKRHRGHGLQDSTRCTTAFVSCSGRQSVGNAASTANPRPESVRPTVPAASSTRRCSPGSPVRPR